MSTDGDLVARGTVALTVDDVEAERERLIAAGLSPENSFQGTYSTLATITDPDGNIIVLATPPAKPYPKA